MKGIYSSFLYITKFNVPTAMYLTCDQIPCNNFQFRLPWYLLPERSGISKHGCGRRNIFVCSLEMDISAGGGLILPAMVTKGCKNGGYRRVNGYSLFALLVRFLKSLGWGTNNVLVPQLLGRSFQKARNFTSSSHQNAGFKI